MSRRGLDIARFLDGRFLQEDVGEYSAKNHPLVGICL